ncbi:MAG: hypothetical protein K2X82_21240 [Gemmataceae bacterium]|nr:hypothetical protein [Gemmataceae bacterium]
MEPEPDYDAVELFWVQGVVRGGQVVLDPPLDLPDGTVVTVTKYHPDENPLPRGPKWKLTEEEWQEFDRLSLSRASVAEWEAFRTGIERKRGAA